MRTSAWTPALLACGVVAGGVLVADPGAGFPPGAPEGAPEQLSWRLALAVAVGWTWVSGVALKWRQRPSDSDGNERSSRCAAPPSTRWTRWPATGSWATRRHRFDSRGVAHVYRTRLEHGTWETSPGGSSWRHDFDLRYTSVG